jgi:hypothetical protein
MDHQVDRGQRLYQANHQGIGRGLGGEVNRALGVRSVALISANEEKWKSRARSAASLSFFESGSYGRPDRHSAGLVRAQL